MGLREHLIQAEPGSGTLHELGLQAGMATPQRERFLDPPSSRDWLCLASSRPAPSPCPNLGRLAMKYSEIHLIRKVQELYYGNDGRLLKN